MRNNYSVWDKHHYYCGCADFFKVVGMQKDEILGAGRDITKDECSKIIKVYENSVASGNSQNLSYNNGYLKTAKRYYAQRWGRKK